MTDIIQDAEIFVKTKLRKQNQRGEWKIDLTTSQIRKFLSSVNKIDNRMLTEKDVLSPDIINEIKYLKIMLAYQTGRAGKLGKGTNPLEPLYEDLIPKIDAIADSKKKFIEFARYVEAIVAYHKFYGGN